MREGRRGEMVLQLESFSLVASDEHATEPEKKMELPLAPPVVFMDVNVVPEHDKEGLASTISALEGNIHFFFFRSHTAAFLNLD